MITEELGICPELLYRWRREHQRYENNSFPGKGKMTDLERENARLSKELRDATMERKLALLILTSWQKSARPVKIVALTI